MRRQRLSYRSVANDPKRTLRGLKSPSAAVSCRTELCYPFCRKHGRYWPVKRRSFITLLGSAAAWPLAARAQETRKVYRIGFLWDSPAVQADSIEAFRRGLRELGWIDG